MKIKLKVQGGSFAKKINADLRDYKMEVGILQDKQLRSPKWGQFSTYAGQKVVKRGKLSKARLTDVAERLDKQYEWLQRPFTNPKNKELIQVADYIIDALNEPKGIKKQRILNATQAVIRNPILRGDYGKNSPKYASKKGFNKPLILTGQLFQNIFARFK